MEDLMKKRVAVKDPAILQFFYPRFKIISDLRQPVDCTEGVIFTGTVTEDALKRLDRMSGGKYIIISDFPDIDLSNPSGLIKAFMPALQDKASQYDSYDLEDFLILLKQYVILQRKIPVLREDESGTFALFRAMTSTKDTLYREYFALLDTTPVKVVASSVLTFLLKVKNKAYSASSPAYTKLLNSAYLKFGQRIKPAVMQYIESKQKAELALLTLLDTLNG